MPDPREPTHPQVAALFQALRANRASRVLDPRTLREGTEQFAAVLCQGAPAVAREETLEIPGPAGPIGVEVYWPRGAPAPAPLLVYLHGGGYVTMSPRTHSKLAKRLGADAGAVVASVDYRLAPEHPFPAPQEDCLAAFRWLRTHATDLGADPERVGVAGDSAGGNAAAAVCLRLAAAGEPAPRAVLLISPWLDMALDTDSCRTLGPDDGIIDLEFLTFCRDAFVRDDQIRDPFASPVHGDLTDFPHCAILVGGLDPLRDEALAFARLAEAVGVDVDVWLHEDMPHAFPLFPGIDEADEAHADMGRFLRSALAP